MIRNVQRTAVARSTKAEITHSDLSWFAVWLMQEVMETPPTNEDIKRLILDATQQLREIRKSFPPARPQIGR